MMSALLWGRALGPHARFSGQAPAGDRRRRHRSLDLLAVLCLSMQDCTNRVQSPPCWCLPAPAPAGVIAGGFLAECPCVRCNFFLFARCRVPSSQAGVRPASSLPSPAAAAQFLLYLLVVPCCLARQLPPPWGFAPFRCASKHTVCYTEATVVDLLSWVGLPTGEHFRRRRKPCCCCCCCCCLLLLLLLAAAAAACCCCCSEPPGVARAAAARGRPSALRTPLGHQKRGSTRGRQCSVPSTGR